MNEHKVRFPAPSIPSTAIKNPFFCAIIYVKVLRTVFRFIYVIRRDETLDKVVLIFPKTGLDKYSQLPLGLLSVASTIVDDYEVKIIDQRLDNNWANKIESESQNSICVGITSMTGEQILNGLEKSKIAKKKYKRNLGWNTSNNIA